MISNKTLCYIFVILVLFFVFSRFINLDADRPLHVMAESIDEGYKSQPAKYRALFGTWYDDDSSSGLLTAPLFNLILFPVYNLLGVSLFSTRVLSAVAGIISVLLLYLILRRDDRKVALYASGLLAVNHFFFIVTRVGLPESLVIATILLSFYVVFLNETKTFNYFLGGLIMGLGFLLKVNQIYFIPAILLFLFMQLITKNIRIKHICVYLFGYGVLVFGYWLFFLSSSNPLFIPILEFIKADSPLYLFVFRIFSLFVNLFFSLPSICFLAIPTLAYLVLFRFIPLRWKSFVSYVRTLNFTEKIAFSILIGTLVGIVFSSLVPRKMSFLIIPLVIYPVLLFKQKIPYRDNHRINLLEIFIVYILFISVIVNYILLIDMPIFKQLYNVVVYNFSLTGLFYAANIQVISFLLLLFIGTIAFIVLYFKYRNSVKFRGVMIRLGIFFLIALLVLGFIKFNYHYIFEPYFYGSNIVFGVLSLLIAFLIFICLMKNPMKTGKTSLVIYVVYCVLAIVLASLIFPSFTVRDMNQRIDKWTSGGDYIIGYASHGLSFESGTRPIFFKFNPPFNKYVNYSIYDKYKPKLYLRSYPKFKQIPDSPMIDEVPYDLKYLGRYRLEPIFGFGRPREVIEVYRIVYYS
ncbi:glycosyltransferase family 39 protein [Candidatus Woesearchaeota archaeon]|nr:glycosyltransferase family 39 protein [Candidatus Woesearchaeota archaeon]